MTSGFLHFGIIHLAFNMLLLFQLGQLLEPAIGRIRFALLYFAALLAGSAGRPARPAQRAPRRRVGRRVRADGRGVRRPAQPRRQPVLDRPRHVLLLNLLLTFTIPGISIGGHIGGIVGGARRRLGRAGARTTAGPEVGDLRRAGRRDRASRCSCRCIVVKT